MDFIYDIETFPNVFTISVECAEYPITLCFEISDRINQSKEICKFVHWLQLNNHRMVGFNNIGFDYPVLHLLLRMGSSDAKTLYQKAQSIIEASDSSDRFFNAVSSFERLVPQIDLFKIHHFDNFARSTSLKEIEFNMKAEFVKSLPFEPGKLLNDEEINVLRNYNSYDVQQTKRFYLESTKMIEFREDLSKKYGKDFLNHNDTKIGKDYFIRELENNGIQCYQSINGKKEPRQTKREVLDLNEAILKNLSFENQELNRILSWFRSQKITETKGIFKDIEAVVKGFKFVFGLGGIHGSVGSRIITSNDEYEIVDYDVSSYYPNLAISNRFYPEHLSEKFCDIYQDLYEQRKTFSKKSIENAMLKLALNGVYGDSNNSYSPFYDPLFTMKITLNGQLLLCKLAENLMKYEDIEMIQINTDGLTIRKPKKLNIDDVTENWEFETGLTLEKANYGRMFIRDVNNYIAEFESKDVKTKGCYDYSPVWHQNHSFLVVAYCANKFLLEGISIKNALQECQDNAFFMARIKCPRNSYLEINQEKLPNFLRYYVSTEGDYLTKWMPPLKNKTAWRPFQVHVGRKIKVCNDISDFNRNDVDYSFYEEEVEKICLILR